MGNIKNFNFNKLDLKLSNSDYWDFYLANDNGPTPYCGPLSEGDCFVVWYDFNNVNIYANSANTSPEIFSLVTWTGGTNTGYTFNTVGLTGIDNGLITFDKPNGDTSNVALLSTLTGTTLVIPSGDTRLRMTRVTGTTGNYVYPYDIDIDPSTPLIGNFARLYGGFYQGYYKIDGSTYQVLPTRVNHAWTAEFWLTTKEYGTPNGSILNDTYPENSGFFFYMGTRAENKFWNQWEGADTGCTSSCTTTECSNGESVSEWCTVPKENQITVVGDYGLGISLDPPRTEIDLVTNGFLIYGKTKDGRPDALTGSTIYDVPSTATTCYYCTVCGTNHDGLGTQSACSYDGKGIAVANIRKTKTTDTNPFLLYGRASGIINSGDTIGCCGGPNDGLGSKTINNFNGVETPETSIDYNLDIIDNALGFRVKPDGSIGYRLLTVTGTCITHGTDRKYITGTTIHEAYSIPELIDPRYWYNIVIKYVTDNKSDCDLKVIKPRNGKLKFYINGMLKFTVYNFPEFIGKRLDEYKAKQVGVPFNFSLGGGSQGLIESQTFGGLDLSDRGLPIEQNFGGSFIGGISQFKFNICDMSLCQIQNAYEAEAPKYGFVDDNLIQQENTFFILQQDGYGINW